MSAPQNPPAPADVGVAVAAAAARAPSRRAIRLGAGLIVAFLLFDWSRAPAEQWTVRFELAAIERYQAWVSPLLARSGARCRFTPSCSRYAAVVIARDGALAGNARAAWRILRCAPWTPAGTVDWP